MSKHDPFSDLREAAEKMGLPPREIAHILKIAEANKVINEGRSKSLQPFMPAPEPGPRRVLSFARAPKVEFATPVLWCGQCDRRVKRLEAASCASPWCKAKPRIQAVEQ